MHAVLVHFTAKYLCNKFFCPWNNIWAIITKVFQRYLEMFYFVSNCEKGFHAVGNTGVPCKFHSHFSFALIYSISSPAPHLSTAPFFFDRTIACLCFLSPYIFGGMNCSLLSLGSGQEFIFSRSIVSECHL